MNSTRSWMKSPKYYLKMYEFRKNLRTKWYQSYPKINRELLKYEMLYLFDQVPCLKLDNDNPEISININLEEPGTNDDYFFVSKALNDYTCTELIFEKLRYIFEKQSSNHPDKNYKLFMGVHKNRLSEFDVMKNI